MLPMSLDIGGAETHVVGLAKSMRARGWPVYVASFGGRRVKDLEKAGIPHLFAPLNSRSPLEIFRAYRIVTRIVEEYSIGIVHAHARIPAFIAEKICSVKQIPLVTTYHWTFKAGFPWTFFSKQGDLAIAVSQDIKDYIIKEFGFDPRRVVVIPNGIDLDVFSPEAPAGCREREAMGIPENAGPIVLYVSRLQGDLTGAALVAQDAILSLARKYPGILLLIAGDGEGLKEVKRKALEINRATGRETVRCLGFVLDTPPVYRVSDVVIGMSRVALEAMAVGKPAIIFGPGGVFGPVTADLVPALEERNYTSRNAPLPPAPDILKDQIDSLLSDPSRCHSLGLFGRNLVKERHSMDIVARDTETAYFQALDLAARR